MLLVQERKDARGQPRPLMRYQRALILGGTIFATLLIFLAATLMAFDVDAHEFCPLCDKLSCVELWWDCEVTTSLSCQANLFTNGSAFFFCDGSDTGIRVDYGADATDAVDLQQQCEVVCAA